MKSTVQRAAEYMETLEPSKASAIEARSNAAAALTLELEKVFLTHADGIAEHVGGQTHDTIAEVSSCVLIAMVGLLSSQFERDESMDEATSMVMLHLLDAAEKIYAAKIDLPTWGIKAA